MAAAEEKQQQESAKLSTNAADNTDSESEYVSFTTEDSFDDEAGFEEDEEEDGDVYETLDDSPMKVQNGLYIGSFLAEQNVEAMRKRHITHVLQVGSGMCPSHAPEFKYLSISIDDHPSEDLVQHFDRCFEFINDALQSQGAVLVHCMAGASRSATVIIGYLMSTRNMDYDTAFKVVHAVRPWVCPNKGFQEQLLVFHKIGFDLTQWPAHKPKTIGTRKKNQGQYDFDESDLL